MNLTSDSVVASGTRGNHVCSMLSSSSGVKCWGANENGQLGYGDTAQRGDNANEMGDLLGYVSLVGGGASLQVARSMGLGNLHTCAIVSSTSLVKCWGNNFYGQLGYGDTLDRGDNPSEMGASLPSVSLGTGRTVRHLSVGSNFACAILDNSMLKCWGENFFGQLGLGDKTDRGGLPSHMGNGLPYVQLGTGRSVKQVSCGGGTACAILDDNQLKCWGSNKDGMLGLGSAASRGNNPNEMGDSLGYMDLGTAVFVRNVSLGRAHGCFLAMDSNLVKCWGSNFYGQLGYGDVLNRGDDWGEMGNALAFVALGTGRTAKQVSCGNYHTCALLDNWLVKCWGANGYGQLGYGDTAQRGDNANEMGNSLGYVNLGVGRTARQISSGSYSTCALLDNSYVKCWGMNSNGQLGQGSTAASRSLDPSVLPTVALGTSYVFCRSCFEGFYSPVPCTCEQCPAGSFSSAIGSTACTL